MSPLRFHDDHRRNQISKRVSRQTRASGALLGTVAGPTQVRPMLHRPRTSARMTIASETRFQKEYPGKPGRPSALWATVAGPAQVRPPIQRPRTPARRAMTIAAEPDFEKRARQTRAFRWATVAGPTQDQPITPCPRKVADGRGVRSEPSQLAEHQEHSGRLALAEARPASDGDSAGTASQALSLEGPAQRQVS